MIIEGYPLSNFLVDSLFWGIDFLYLACNTAVTFGVTMANYAGQNLGAGRIDRVKEGVKKCSVLTLIFAVAASAILLLFGKPLTGLFIDGKEAELLARTVCSFTLPVAIGFAGICLAGPIAWIAATIPLAVAYYVVIKKFDQA